MTTELLASDRAPGLFVAPGIHIPHDAAIAPHVTIYAGVQLGEGVSLGQGAILGRPQEIDARSRSPLRPEGAPTVIGDGCRVGSNTVLVAGVRMDARAHVADHALIREGVVLCEDVMVGRDVSVSHGNTVGARTRLQNGVLVGPGTSIEEDVMVSPRVIFVGDPTMGRRPRGKPGEGIVVRRGSRLGANAIVFPSVEIGAEAVVGAAAMVREDVPGRTVVAGTPARYLRAVRDDELLVAWRDPA